MVLTSKTGLQSSIQRSIPRKPQECNALDLRNIAVPAPFVLRPFAGIYNPFPYGCSILCNHPADFEAKDVVKRAKESWASDGKTNPSDGGRATEDAEDLVPEELFKRYTETDSRPITPTPTLASVMTRIPRGRRCVTPDPVPGVMQERTLLVLDLRRSHSQETLSCHATGLPTTILQPPTRSPTPSSGTGLTTTRRPTKPRNRLSPETLTRPEDSTTKPAMMTLPPPSAGEGEDLPRRRGRLRKKGKKSGRDLSAGIEKEVKGFPEPGETQVSAFGIESRLGSARPSLVMQGGDGGSATSLDAAGSGQPTPEPSYLDPEILRQLRRELDQEVIESEFDHKRRAALEEAMRTIPPGHKPAHNEEMVKLQKELRLPPENTELWLSLPRTFSRQSARFELPLDRRELNTMTPLDYMRKHISITSNRRLLYNRVFNRHRRTTYPEEMEVENTERTISGERMCEALGEMMGQALTAEQADWFSGLVGWKDNDWIDFRTWCGISATCERLLGPKFCAQLPTREVDPPNGVEQADFDSLGRRLETLDPDPRLKTILNLIKTL